MSWFFSINTLYAAKQYYSNSLKSQTIPDLHQETVSCWNFEINSSYKQTIQQFLIYMIVCSQTGI